MIIFDIRIGRYSFLALKERDVRWGVVSEMRGEVEIDLPFLRLIFSDYSKSLVR